MKSIICGHTGATGMFVLDELVAADWIESIVTLGRREYPKYANHPKVTQIVVSDMSDLSGVALDSVGAVDLAFDLIATSVKDAFNGEEAYRKVDVEMTSEFARLAKKAGATFIGAIGMVEMKSYDYASKAKRDFVDYVKTLGFAQIAIMKPKWVDRETSTKWYENFYTLFGLLATKASHMARCIVWAAKNQTEHIRMYDKKEIKQIGMRGVL